MKQISSTRPFSSAARCDPRWCDSRCRRSSATVRASHSRSASGSQRACSGRSVRNMSATTPSTTAGKPSTRNSHCHPARPSHAIQRQQRFRQRRADHHRHRRGGHEQRARPRAIGGGNPVGQIQHHSRKEAGLRHAEQHAHRIEAPLPDDEHHRHRDEAPEDHDARDPQPRADAVEDQVARDLEQAIAQEEQAAAQAVGGLAQAEVALQFLGGEADVHAIDVGDHVTDEDEGNQTPDDASDRGTSDLCVRQWACGRVGGRQHGVAAPPYHTTGIGGKPLRAEPLPAFPLRVLRTLRRTSRAARVGGAGPCALRSLILYRPRMRIGILGAGNISDTHARAARAIPGVEVVAVYGQNQQRASALAGAHGARAYDTLDRFLDHRPMDIVAIGNAVGAARRRRHGRGRARAARPRREADRRDDGARRCAHRGGRPRRRHAWCVLSGSPQARRRDAERLTRSRSARHTGAGVGPREVVPLAGVLLRLAMAWPPCPRRWRRAHQPGHSHARPAAPSLRDRSPRSTPAPRRACTTSRSKTRLSRR